MFFDNGMLNGLDKSAPDFSLGQFNPHNMNANTVVFFKPSGRIISPQAVRGNLYNFSDSFTNQYRDAIDRTIRSGNNGIVNDVLSSSEARDAVTINPNVDAVIDLNQLNDCWKFMLVLVDFANQRIMKSGNAYMAVITGRCELGEEPCVTVGSQEMLNPNCRLYIESKTVYQTYKNNFRNGGSLDYATRFSTGWGHQSTVKQTTNQELYENTPGSMNFSADVNPHTYSTEIVSEPVATVGMFAPTAIERSHQLASSTLANTMTAVTNTFRDTEARKLSPINDFGSNIHGLIGHDPSTTMPKLISNLKKVERQHSNWSHDQFGPTVNSNITVADLSEVYGVKDIRLADTTGAKFWCGSDQITSSQTTLFESMLSTAIPTYMTELQLNGCSFAVLMKKDPMILGPVTPITKCNSIDPVIPTIQGDAITHRFNSLIHLLTPLFEQIYATGGDFIFNARINIATTSSLALHYLSNVVDDHNYEFFPSEFALTSPAVGSLNTVASNQAVFGHFLNQLCVDQYQQHKPADTYATNPVASNWNTQSVPNMNNMPQQNNWGGNQGRMSSPLDSWDAAANFGNY